MRVDGRHIHLHVLKCRLSGWIATGHLYLVWEAGYSI